MPSPSSRRVRAALWAWLVAAPFMAWAAPPAALTADDARHFLLRTGFAPSPADISALVGQSADAVVARTLARPPQTLTPAPEFTHRPFVPPPARDAPFEQAQAWRNAQRLQGMEIKAWWMREMVATGHPLHERMTLFWHNHFATSQAKVTSGHALWRQHLLLRQHALGRFDVLLHAIAKDPAMLVYLDGANSRRESPNENFAREVMELFTLGEASQRNTYTERDIREAARAFTGWSIDRETFEFRWRPMFHDRGDKTVLGRTGAFDGDAVLDILLEQDATARFVAGKLWREFVSAERSEAGVLRVAQAFRSSGYDIRAALRALLLSDEFWAPENRAGLIKSPVEWTVGLVRQFEASAPDGLLLAAMAASLGQNLLAPPNVKGWPGQDAWINSAHLLTRQRLALGLLAPIPADPVQRPLAAREAMAETAGAMGPRAPAATPTPATAGGVGFGFAPPELLALGRPRLLELGMQLRRTRVDTSAWLAAQGVPPDAEPDAGTQARLARQLLAMDPVQWPAAATAHAWLRALATDPAYQLK